MEVKVLSSLYTYSSTVIVEQIYEQVNKLNNCKNVYSKKLLHIERQWILFFFTNLQTFPRELIWNTFQLSFCREYKSILQFKMGFKQGNICSLVSQKEYFIKMSGTMRGCSQIVRQRCLFSHFSLFSKRKHSLSDGTREYFETSKDLLLLIADSREGL